MINAEFCAELLANLGLKVPTQKEAQASRPARRFPWVVTASDRRLFAKRLKLRNCWGRSLARRSWRSGGRFHSLGRIWIYVISGVGEARRKHAPSFNELCDRAITTERNCEAWRGGGRFGFSCARKSKRHPQEWLRKPCHAQEDGAQVT